MENLPIGQTECSAKNDALMEISVVECGEQLESVGLRLVMIDKQLRLVCRDHPPDPVHGGD